MANKKTTKSNSKVNKTKTDKNKNVKKNGVTKKTTTVKVEKKNTKKVEKKQAPKAAKKTKSNTKKNAKKKELNRTIIWLTISSLLIAVIIGIAFWGDYIRPETELGSYFSSEMSQRDKVIEVASKKLKELGDNTEVNELKTTKKKYKNEYFYIVESKAGNTLEVRVGDFKITTINGVKQ